MKWNKAALNFEAYLPTSILDNIAERNVTFYFHNYPTFNICAPDKNFFILIYLFALSNMSIWKHLYLLRLYFPLMDLVHLCIKKHES